MSIKTAYFRFYADLNPFLPKEKRQIEFSHQFIDKTTIKDMIEGLGVPHTQIDLMLVNNRPVDFNYHVKENDRISVYPLFFTIDISEIKKTKTIKSSPIKFALDVHLGKLANRLRMFGFDTFYKNQINDPELVEIANKEKRTLLTRDRGILKRKATTNGCYIKNIQAHKQVIEVINRFKLWDKVKPLTRCLVCNEQLSAINKEKIINKIPDGIKKTYKEFYFCTYCQKVFWKGSHYDNMIKLLNKLSPD